MRRLGPPGGCAEAYPMADPRSIFLLLAATNALVALAMAFANRRHRRLRSIALWATGNAVAVVAWLLYAFRGPIPFPVSLFGGYAGITAMHLLQISAIINASGGRTSWLLAGGIWALSIASFASDFIIYGAEPRHLVVSASFGIALWTLAPAIVLLCLAHRPKPAYFAAAGLLVANSLVDFYRGVDALFGPNPTATLFDVNIAQTSTFLMEVLSVLGSAVCFLVIARAQPLPAVAAEQRGS